MNEIKSDILATAEARGNIVISSEFDLQFPTSTTASNVPPKDADQVAT